VSFECCVVLVVLDRFVYVNASTLSFAKGSRPFFLSSFEVPPTKCQPFIFDHLVVQKVSYHCPNLDRYDTYLGQISHIREKTVNGAGLVESPVQ
jgi:hypothetical protein